MVYTKEMRNRIEEDLKGKSITAVEYDEEDNYWIVTLSNGSEITFRFMAEIVN